MNDERHDFELPGGYVKALGEHLGYGHEEKRPALVAETGAVSGAEDVPVLVLSEHECAQLLYELTDDKRYLE